MTSPDRRLGADQIKSHPFFYGVDWDSIRRIGSPFVPNLRSITDTSYFPTDEIDQSPAEAPAASADAAQKDLAFLGCVVSLFSTDLAQLAAQLYLQEVYSLFSCFLNYHCSVYVEVRNPETRIVVQYVFALHLPWPSPVCELYVAVIELASSISICVEQW